MVLVQTCNVDGCGKFTGFGEVKCEEHNQTVYEKL